jgi:uncharacterized delta-60 repeat protein
MNIFLITLGIIFIYSFLINTNFHYQAKYSKQSFEESIYYHQMQSANTPVVSEWNRTWGGTRFASGNGVVVDSSNNVYITGLTYGVSSTDMLLMKYDSTGVQQWIRTWGGTEHDLGWGVTLDSSNNIYIAGQTESFGAGFSDMLLVKYNSNGVKQWERTWGDTAYEVGRGVAVDSSNNVYLAGGHDAYWTGSDNMHLVKYDSSGVQLWNRTWGGTEWDVGRGVTIDSSDNVYFVGTTENMGMGSSDMVMVKYNSSGVKQWERTWGGTDHDEAFGVAVDSSDCVYLGGRTRSFGAGDSDMILVKYDSSGVQQWNHTWGGVNYDLVLGLTMDSSDNVYLAGQTESFGAGSSDMILVKYSSSGVQQWNCTWGGTKSDISWGVAATSSDNVFLVGSTMSFGAEEINSVLVKYAPDIYKPIINIKNPSQNEKFEDIAPDYSISIIEPNLVSIWYTIDGGFNNYTITQLSGIINQSAWYTAPNGSIILGFYAEDFVGNIGYSEVLVKKNEKNEKEQEISGYNIFLLIGIISVISTIIIKRKRKN